MSLERSVTEAQAKEYLESYSIGLGPTERFSLFSQCPALLLDQGGDGDQAGGQDQGGTEEGSSHQLEEDRKDHHKVLEVQIYRIQMLCKKRDFQKARHKRRRSAARVLGARGSKFPEEEEEGGTWL